MPNETWPPTAPRSRSGRSSKKSKIAGAPVAAIAYGNKAVIYDLLFRTAADTLLTIAADPKHLGARIGLTAVLHTWGSAMTHHPHVHIVVPGGEGTQQEARLEAGRYI